MMLSNGNIQVSNKIVQNHKNRFLLAFLLILIGVLGRTVFHFGENIEFVTAVTLLAGSFLGFFWTFFVPLTIMAISDIIIGNTNIFIFTWSAYLLIGLLALIFLRQNKGFVNNILKAEFTGILASLVFYLWTNFGVWALDGFSMYSDNLSGLVDSYIMGIPFFKANLFSNLIIVPLSFYLFQLLLSWRYARSKIKKILFTN